MPTTQEKNQFRRLIGDYGANSVSDSEVTSILDDATLELTTYFSPSPVTTFDTLNENYHTEVIYKAAINWWWNYASLEVDKQRVSVGTGGADPSQRWVRAQSQIDKLQQHYDRIQQLGVNITIGNYSRFSKQTLSRLGGEEEENDLTKFYS